MVTRAGERRFMFPKGAESDQRGSCVLTILYTRIRLRISTFGFPMCSGP
jgi:hypothetical protein